MAGQKYGGRSRSDRRPKGASGPGNWAANKGKRCLLPPFLANANQNHQQISDWYKARRKQQRAEPSQPKAVLDLTGGTRRKLAPYQFHHAYSIRFYRPKDSPLRELVSEYWERRKEKEIIDRLSPFISNNNFDSPITFHGAVMRWKCSLLTDEECQEHQDWITQNLLEREKEEKQPWSATQGVGEDELTAENKYIQG
jgi:hypothetical protein